MSCTSYCEFNKTLGDSFENGLPRCLSDFVSSVVLFFVALLGALPLVVSVLHRRKQRSYQYRTIQTDFEQSIDSPASDILLNTETSNVSPQEKFLDNPAGFIYGENYRTSFLYTCQLFLHLCQILLPLIDLVVKGSMDSSRIQGVTIVKDALMFMAWLLAYFDIMVETQTRYHARLCRYSVVLLLFWGLVFVNNNIVLVSWNSKEWWFQRKTSVENAEFVLFWLRYSFSAIILFLGMKAPGLYKPNYRFAVDENGLPETQNESVSNVLYNFFLRIKLRSFIAGTYLSAVAGVQKSSTILY